MSVTPTEPGTPPAATPPADAQVESSESTDQSPARHVPIAEHVEERKRRQAAEQSAAALQKQLDDIAAANLSDLEKAQKAAKDAQDVAAKATVEALRLRVAAKHGISDEDADLFLTGSDQETVERQATALVARTSTSPKPDLSQGAKGTPAGASPEQDFANFLGAQLSSRG